LDLINQKGKPKKLPPVFPIVLYNGKDKWTAPTEIKDLIENHDLLGEFGVQFKYFKIAENEFSAESLLKIQKVISTIFFTEIHYDLDLLLGEIKRLFKKEDRSAVSLLFNWFRHLYENKRVTEADFEKLNQVYYDEGEFSMLVEAIKQEKSNLLKQGKLEGKFEEKFEIARAMLVEGSTISFIMKVTGLSQKEIEQLRNQTN
jgi:predicted transposase/invertase (TIGR01784 family)